MPSVSSVSKLGWGDPGAEGSAAATAFRRAHIVTIEPVPGVRIPVNRELAQIFTVAVAELHQMLRSDGGGLDVDDRADDWGYANRDIRGYPGSKSYHAWGLAIDVNATENVLGKRKTTFPVAKTRAMCKRLGLTWGYDYKDRPDPMHFEFKGSVADARRITATLAGSPPAVTPPAAPTPPSGPRLLELTSPMMKGADIGDWQRLLIGAGELPAGSDDNVFGPQTEAATKRFQRRLKVVADGRVGPQTRKAVDALLRYLVAVDAAKAWGRAQEVLRLGSRGPVVMTWQPVVGAKKDGAFGPVTRARTVDWQRARGLKGDGVVGPATWGQARLEGRV